MKINLPLIFIFLLLCSVIQSLDRITLTIDKNNNPNTRKIAGPLGTFGLVTDTKNDTIFNTSDIEESTLFDGGFYLEDAFENAYAYFECRLWNPNGMNVIIICSIDNSTKPDSTYILNFEYGHLIWGDYDITIKGEKDLNITLETKSFNIPFIYSNPQTIDLNEGDQYYQLRFKTISYQREKLAIIADLKSYSLISDFDDMNTTDNELTISISRQKIEEAYTNNRTLQLALLNGQIGIHEYEFVLDINAEYDKPPQDLVLTVNETLNDQAESHSIIAFKTNLVDVPPLTTSTFKVEIYMKDTRDYIYCFFKKYEDDNPMLLLCESIDEDFYFYMDGTEINPGEIHYKYNFTIERSPLYELIHVNGTGKRILYVSPQTFDFTVQDKYYIEYFVEEGEYFQNIKFV